MAASVAELERMRAALKGAYHSKQWWAKVDKMSEAQLFAIFMRFKNEKKI